MSAATESSALDHCIFANLWVLKRSVREKLKIAQRTKNPSKPDLSENHGISDGETSPTWASQSGSGSDSLTTV